MTFSAGFQNAASLITSDAHIRQHSARALDVMCWILDKFAGRTCRSDLVSFLIVVIVKLDIHLSFKIDSQGHLNVVADIAQILQESSF